MQELSRSPAIDRLTRPAVFAALLFVLSAGLSWVAADRVMPIPDEGALLTAAVKILHGGVFYRDVDAYAFPGMAVLLAGAMGLFGEHLSVARALAGAVFCATVLGAYACALALVDRRRAALCGLSLLSIKFLAFPIYTMFFYADAAVATALLALAIFLRHDFSGASAGLFWVGVLAGLSVVTKQSTGLLVVAVFALVLAFPGVATLTRPGRTRLPELACFGAGTVLVLSAMSIYFAWHGLFGEMLRAGLLRPFSGYLPTSGLSFLPPLAWWDFGGLRSRGPTYYPQLYFELALHWARLEPAARGLYLGLGEIVPRLVYSSIPIVFGAAAWLWVHALRTSRSREGEPAAGELARGRFFSAAGVAAAITVSAFPRADFIHVITVYPAVVLILFAIGRPSTIETSPAARAAGRPQADRRIRIEVGVVASILVGSALLLFRYDALLTHRLQLDRAGLWVKPQHAWLGPLVEFVQEEVPEGEPLFVYGHEAHWYFLANRYTARPFSQLYPGMAGETSGGELAETIRRTRPRIVLQGVLHWPGMPDLRTSTPILRDTLETFYVSVPDAIPHPPRPEMLRVWRLRD